MWKGPPATCAAPLPCLTGIQDQPRCSAPNYCRNRARATGWQQYIKQDRGERRNPLAKLATAMAEIRCILRWRKLLRRKKFGD